MLHSAELLLRMDLQGLDSHGHSDGEVHGAVGQSWHSSVKEGVSVAESNVLQGLG